VQLIFSPLAALYRSLSRLRGRVGEGVPRRQSE
jgi:hypothetical protein